MRNLLLISVLSCAQAADFRISPVVENLRDPIDLALAPGGDLIVIEREGRILRVRPSTGGIFPVADLRVSALRAKEPDSPWAREDGLLGVALDPRFPENRRLYLYYSHPEQMVNRLSRFVVKDGLLDTSSEKVILDIPVDRRDRVCHHGGSIKFDRRGLLYLSTGDNTNPFQSAGYAPIDERPGREHANALRSAANTHDLRGKILRIRPTEDGYDIPAGNLFPPGTPKTRPEIYVMGCRNPYRISIDPVTDTLYWGEVGPDAGEAGPKGPAGHDEINQATSAGNYGWPWFVADNRPYAAVDFSNGTPGALADPQAPVNTSAANTGISRLPAARGAWIWYPYANSKEFPALGSGGRNAMAGPVVRHDSRRKFNLIGRNDGPTLLAYDWARGRIWKARIGEGEKLARVEPLLDGLQRPIDLEMDDEGTLWVLEYSTEWWFGTNGRIRRIRPQGKNEPPTVRVESKGDLWTATASDPSARIEWWLTEGSRESKIGTGATIRRPDKGTELRAVASDRHGESAVARVPLVRAESAPRLDLVLESGSAPLGFGQQVAFTVPGDVDPAKLVVRARYVPPTGHDAGGPVLEAEAAERITARQCFACHQVDKPSVGPAFLEVAMKYRGQSGAASHLDAKIARGGSGVWGEVPMPPQPALADDERGKIIAAVLKLADTVSETRGAKSGKIGLIARPAGAGAGGDWEFTVEAPGLGIGRKRVPASQGTAPEAR